MQNNDNLRLVATTSTLDYSRKVNTNTPVAISLNKRQAELYGRLMIGVKHYEDKKLYPADYVAKMNSLKKKKIQHLSRRAHWELNLFKQQMLILQTDKLMDKLFTTDLFKKLLSLDEQVDPKFKCKLSPKDLGIRKEDIINLFIKKRILPQNFFEL